MKPHKVEITSINNRFNGLVSQGYVEFFVVGTVNGLKASVWVPVSTDLCEGSFEKAKELAGEEAKKTMVDMYRRDWWKRPFLQYVAWRRQREYERSRANWF